MTSCHRHLRTTAEIEHTNRTGSGMVWDGMQYPHFLAQLRAKPPLRILETPLVCSKTDTDSNACMIIRKLTQYRYHREHDFQLRVHQKPFVGRTLPGPAGGSHRAPQTPLLDLGRESGTGKGHIRNKRKGRRTEKKEKRRTRGKKRERMYHTGTSLFPLPALRTDEVVFSDFK